NRGSASRWRTPSSARRCRLLPAAPPAEPAAAAARRLRSRARAAPSRLLRRKERRQRAFASAFEVEQERLANALQLLVVDLFSAAVGGGVAHFVFALLNEARQRVVIPVLCRVRLLEKLPKRQK